MKSMSLFVFLNLSLNLTLSTGAWALDFEQTKLSHYQNSALVALINFKQPATGFIKPFLNLFKKQPSQLQVVENYIGNIGDDKIQALKAAKQNHPGLQIIALQGVTNALIPPYWVFSSIDGSEEDLKNAELVLLAESTNIITHERFVPNPGKNYDDRFFDVTVSYKAIKPLKGSLPNREIVIKFIHEEWSDHHFSYGQKHGAILFLVIKNNEYVLSSKKSVVFLQAND